MTNGERIRLMSDEELASFLEGLPARAVHATTMMQNAKKQTARTALLNG